MKYKDLENYLVDNGYSPILAAGSHVKWVKAGGKLHILIRRQRPHYEAGKGLVARVQRIVEKINV